MVRNVIFLSTVRISPDFYFTGTSFFVIRVFLRPTYLTINFTVCTTDIEYLPAKLIFGENHSLLCLHNNHDNDVLLMTTTSGH